MLRATNEAARSVAGRGRAWRSSRSASRAIGEAALGQAQYVDVHAIKLLRARVCVCVCVCVRALHGRVSNLMVMVVMAAGARIEKERQERERTEKERTEKLAQAITQSVNQKISSHVEKVIRTEVQATVLPQVGRLVSSAVDKSLTEKLLPQLEKAVQRQIDGTVANAIGREVSQQVAAQIGASVQEPVGQAFKTYFETMLVPAFESACKNMFEQLNDTFQRGIEYNILCFVTAWRERERERERDGDIVIVVDSHWP